MPEVAAQASGMWVGIATEYLRQQGCSAIVEAALRNEPMLRREFEAFREAGFRTELHVLAVPLEVLGLGTITR